MNARRQSLAELDALTSRAGELADEYASKLTTLERNRFCPEPQVVPVDGGWQIHLPGRVPGSVVAVAQIFPTKAEAKQALRRFQRGGQR